MHWLVSRHTAYWRGRTQPFLAAIATKTLRTIRFAAAFIEDGGSTRITTRYILARMLVVINLNEGSPCVDEQRHRSMTAVALLESNPDRHGVAAMTLERASQPLASISHVCRRATPSCATRPVPSFSRPLWRRRWSTGTCILGPNASSAPMQ
jgi:hypothetical protein